MEGSREGDGGGGGEVGTRPNAMRGKGRWGRVEEVVGE